MHRISLFAAVTAFLLSAPSASCGQEGQDWTPPKPAPEMKKLERFIGNWKGGGTNETPRGPSRWSSTSTCSWAFGGHVLQEDMTFEFDPEIPGKMVYRRYVAWDAKKNRYVQYSFGNMGEMHTTGIVVWADDSTLVSSMNNLVNGLSQFDRSIIRLKDDGYTMEFERAVGSQPVRTLVTGTFEKTGAGFSISGQDWEPAFVPVPAPKPMPRVHRMAGDYSMKGTMSMMPGVPAMPIAGNETIRPIFGGHFLKMEVVGDPMPYDPTQFIYRAFALIGWNATNQCYTEFYLNNMGEVGTQELRFVDDHQLVTASASVEHGQPTALRGIVKLDDAGRITKVFMDRLSATHEAERMFTGDYTVTKAKQLDL